MSGGVWEQKKRALKVARYVEAFRETARSAGSDPSSAETMRAILAQIEGATEEQWVALRKTLGEKTVASIYTRCEIADHFRMALDPSENIAIDEVAHVRERLEVGGVGYEFRAKRGGNGHGWDWVIFASGDRIIGTGFAFTEQALVLARGFAHGIGPQRAIEAAKAAVGEKRGQIREDAK